MSMSHWEDAAAAMPSSSQFPTQALPGELVPSTTASSSSAMASRRDLEYVMPHSRTGLREAVHHDGDDDGTDLRGKGEVMR